MGKAIIFVIHYLSNNTLLLKLLVSGNETSPKDTYDMSGLPSISVTGLVVIYALSTFTYEVTLVGRFPFFLYMCVT